MSAWSRLGFAFACACACASKHPHRTQGRATKDIIHLPRAYIDSKASALPCTGGLMIDRRNERCAQKKSLAQLYSQKFTAVQRQGLKRMTKKPAFLSLPRSTVNFTKDYSTFGQLEGGNVVGGPTSNVPRPTCAIQTFSDQA
jgi:hypothetical protein